MREVRNYYTSGSEALAPERIISDPDYKYRQERRERHQRELENARKRQHKRSMRVSKLKAFTTCFGVIVVSAALFLFVFLQNQVAACKKNIAVLEDKITQVNTLNDAAKSRIDSSVNLTDIRDQAINRMGMVYADAEHVVYYEVSGSDYMKAY